MKYASRWMILFVMALLASRITPGFTIEQHWYSFVWALIIGGINAGVRPFLLGIKSKCHWPVIIVVCAILNLILFWITSVGAFSWLGLTITTFGGAMLAAAIVTVPSAICNHFIGIKGPDR